MKRPLIIIAALAMSLGLTAAARAQTVPKTICAEFETERTVKLVMAPKLAGTVQMTAPTKFYTIVGEIYDSDPAGVLSAPVSGGGYLKGSSFHFGFTSKYTVGGVFCILEAQGVWQLDTASGYMLRRVIVNSIPETEYREIEAADCTSLPALPRGASGLASSDSTALPPILVGGGN